jgi:hypothetical protein
MNTTNNKVILLTVAITAVALAAATKVGADLLPTAAVALSYLAVGALFIVAAIDYRVGPKDYAGR